MFDVLRLELKLSETGLITKASYRRLNQMRERGYGMTRSVSTNPTSWSGITKYILWTRYMKAQSVWLDGLGRRLMIATTWWSVYNVGTRSLRKIRSARSILNFSGTQRIRAARGHMLQRSVLSTLILATYLDDTRDHAYSWRPHVVHQLVFKSYCNMAMGDGIGGLQRHEGIPMPLRSYSTEELTLTALWIV